MCLTLKHTSVLSVAKEDIKVYKVITDDNQSIYHSFMYRPNRLYRLRKPLKRMGLNNNQVEFGFHSFQRQNDAVNWGRSYGDMPWKIVECTIPKGAKFFEGVWGFANNASIVSTSLRTGDLRGLDYVS